MYEHARGKVPLIGWYWYVYGMGLYCGFLNQFALKIVEIYEFLYVERKIDNSMGWNEVDKIGKIVFVCLVGW